MPAVLTACWLCAQHQPIVIAHRGSSGYLPEHTLAAKAMAYAQGADFIEQDVVLSKDGVPIVSHDIHLDSVTNVATVFPGRQRSDGRFYAIDFTWDEIQQLQVNERIDMKKQSAVFPQRYPIGTSPLRMHSLAEELDLIAGLNRSTGKSIGIYPEIKQPTWHLQQGQDISRLTIQVLSSKGFGQATDLCWLQCFEWSETKRIRQQLGWKGRLVQLLGSGQHKPSDSDYEAMQTEEGLRMLGEVVDGIGPELRMVVGRGTGQAPTVTTLVRLAKQNGLAVHPYTLRADSLPAGFDDIDQLHQALFLQAEVDGAFTDFPDVTAQFVAKHRAELTRLQGLEPIVLWPQSPPGRITAQGQERDTSKPESPKVQGRHVTRLGDVAVPTLTLYPAPSAQNTGSVVLVCPGGGYHILAWDLEGTEVCQWLNSIGVNAALLKYRVPRGGKEVPIEPLQDAQRAISILRSEAETWKIRPDRIGILGFSAGGHLSARACTQFENRAYEPIDRIDRASCRPDFGLLIYPAYLIDGESDFAISSDLPVTSQTPPMFLTMALDDPINPENVLRMSAALHRAKVPNELHLYPSGGHGYGLRPSQHQATTWPARAEMWLRSLGALDR